MLRIIGLILITILWFVWYLLIMLILLATTGWGYKEWTCECIAMFAKLWNINEGDIIKYRNNK